MTTLIKPQCNPSTQRNTQTHTHSQFQQGFTLIELMVSMAVALIISAGAAALFANTIFNTRTLNSATAINEEANRINDLLARNFRMTGYVDWLSNQAMFSSTTSTGKNPALYNLKTAGNPSIFQATFRDFELGTAGDITQIPLPLSGCEGDAGANTGYVNAPNPLDITCKSTAATGNTLSAVTVAYQVVSSPTAGYTPALPSPTDTVVANQPSAATGMAFDCNNQKTAPKLYAVNRFYLNPNNPGDWRAGDTTQLYDLICQGAKGTAPQPLASNIEQWVVLYGIPPAPLATASASASNDERVEKYLTASQVSAANSWNLVTAIRSCILMAGTRGSAVVTANTTVGSNTTQRDCLGNFIKTNADARLRQAFTQTVTLRNQVHTPNLLD